MFSERLKNLRKEKKISQLTLSRDLKLGRSTITQYETGSRTPDYQTLLKIAQYFSVSVDYLLGNTPLIAEDDQSSLYVAGTDLPYKKLNENKAANEEDDLFLFSVSDDSMKNTRITTGDWAVVRKQKDFANGDIILLSVNKEEKPMIRKATQKDNIIILHTANPEYPTVFVNASEVKVIGKVVEVRFPV
ncbi:MAG: S24 family peptidase [Dehalobacterium sp.]